MELREINGFPNYLFNADTGEIISKLQRKTHLKIRHISGKTTPSVQMVQGGRRRWIFYNRLLYSIHMNISYDDIPEEIFIIKDDNGDLRVIDKHGQPDQANNYLKTARQMNRLERIEEKIRQLEIMRRAYSAGGNHIEAVQYIENRKDMLINHHIKRFSVGKKNAEMHYALALEWMIEKINNPYSQVTELTISMMWLMNKARQKLSKERPLNLLTTSNCKIEPS